MSTVFTNATDVSVGGGPSTVAAADLDSDGVLDPVTANELAGERSKAVNTLERKLMCRIPPTSTRMLRSGMKVNR